MKKIALIGPAGSLSSQLDRRLSEVHKVRVFRYETPLRPSDLSASGFDELWYMSDASASLERNQKNIADLLAYVRLRQVRVINYVSSIFSAGIRDFFGDGLTTPFYRPAEVHHRYNEAALQSSGCRIRALRRKLLP